MVLLLRVLSSQPHFLSFVLFLAIQGSLARSFSTSSSSSSSSSSSTTTTTPTPSHGWLQQIKAGEPDAILGIAAAFQECTDVAHKVNVCVGAYRDEQGQSWVLPSVRAAEQQMLTNKEPKDYLPIEGDAAFIRKALQFAYGGSGGGNGGDSKNKKKNDSDNNNLDEEKDLLQRIAGVQTLSGTGACRIGGHFLAKFWTGTRTIYIPEPTWGNHWKIFAECGLQTAGYRYYDRHTNRLDLAGMLQDLEHTAADNSIVLLHACAHNPTGCDPTTQEWEQIVDVLERKGHCAFFDSAYQGFASGNAEHDAAAFRSVVQKGTVPVLLAQSFAKNFGLYGERCGTLSVVCDTADQRDIVMSQLRLIIRPMYSNPPRHGSSIVKTILSDALTAQYRDECAHMAQRIQTMRQQLVAKLAQVGSKHDWSHVTSQIGMFAYTGMSAEMCDELTNKYAIYLTRDGRISIAGLNDSNLDYVARAIHDVTDGKSITGGT